MNTCSPSCTEDATFAKCANRLRRRIDAALDESTRPKDGCPGQLREAMRYSLLAPGKRLRPMLVLLAAEACGAAVESALPAACAVEMVHAYSLIHDDLPAMDDDDLRRGRPTCHKKFGEATAILAGDGLLALAFEVLAEGIQPPEVAARCCAVLARAAGACQLVGGQADDMSGQLEETGPESREIEVLESIHRRKTGAIIGVALQLGAMVAGADDAREQALVEYGRRLGLAFQITDDLLDVDGDEAVVGKRLGKDSQQGKLTFPGLLGVARSRRRAERLVEEARDALAPLAPRTGALEALASYVLERSR